MTSIIAADIGGTNCRFGLFAQTNENFELRRTAWISTREVTDTATFLNACARELEHEPDPRDILIAAIAGPTVGEMAGSLTNGNLVLDFRSHAQSQPQVRIINDFTAQAYAIDTPAGRNARPVIAGEQKGAIRGIIGAGTGLGQASLVENGGMPAALPSEYGHTPFPFIGEKENRFHDFLCGRMEISYACGDDVLTGRGLECLHLFLTGKRRHAAEIGESALNRETETLAWYARFYGRACRCWILSTLCAGGLWIAGGIAAQNPLCVTTPHFRQELHNAPRWEAFLRGVPVRLMEDKNSGLWGAARYGQLMAAQH